MMISDVTTAQLLEIQKAILQGQNLTLPDNIDSIFAYSLRELAENILAREKMLADRAILDARLLAAQEEGKKNAWKRAGLEKKETASIQSLRKELADNDAKMAALIHSATPSQKIFDTYTRWDSEEADVRLWMGGGPEPEHIRLREEAQRAMLRAECESIRYNSAHPVWSRPQKQVPSENWVTITPEAYLATLMPR